jgi:peroxiredoxin Q/BCP
MSKRKRSAIWLAAVTWLSGRAASADLAVGDVAPAFSLQGSDGSIHSLAQYKGKQGVVLAWFPKAFTPG